MKPLCARALVILSSVVVCCVLVDGQEDGNSASGEADPTEADATEADPTLSPLLMLALPIGGGVLAFLVLCVICCCCLCKAKKKKGDNLLIESENPGSQNNITLPAVPKDGAKGKITAGTERKSHVLESTLADGKGGKKKNQLQERSPKYRLNQVCGSPVVENSKKPNVKQRVEKKTGVATNQGQERQTVATSRRKGIPTSKVTPDSTERRKRRLAKSRSALRDAVETADIDKLAKAIQEAKDEGFTQYLQPELKKAYRRRAVLLSLRKSTEEVVAVTRDMMRELREYRKPPRAIHDIIIATLLITGDHEDYTREWSKCRILCNTLYPRYHQGLYYRLSGFKLRYLHPDIAARGLEILSEYNLEQVANISKGVSIFYTWTRLICEECTEGVVGTEPAVGRRQARLLWAMAAKKLAEEKNPELCKVAC